MFERLILSDGVEYMIVEIKPDKRTPFGGARESNLIKDIVRELDKVIDEELLSYYSSAHSDLKGNVEERVYGGFAHWLVEMYRNRDE